MTPTTPATGRATGVQTNGEGQKTDAHLNLTVDMTGAITAEVERIERVSTQTAAKRAAYLNRFSTKREKGVR